MLTSGPEHRANCLERLQHTVQRLSINAVQQVAQYPDFVVVADELALDFDHWLEVCESNGYVDKELLPHLRRIDKQLDIMSGEENANLWTVPALQSHAAWKLVRGFAHAAIDAAGWPHGAPPTPMEEGDGFQPAGQ
jgi:hypothetical protein